MASAPTRNRAGAGNRRTFLIVGGVLAAALIGYLAWRHFHQSSTPTLDTSGTPGPDLSGSQAASLAPTGGAASVPGNLPQTLLTAPDTLQTSVQQADTTSGDTPTMTATTTTPGTPIAGPNYGTGTPTTFTIARAGGGITYTQSAPGSDYYAAAPASISATEFATRQQAQQITGAPHTAGF